MFKMGSTIVLFVESPKSNIDSGESNADLPQNIEIFKQDEKIRFGEALFKLN